MSSSDDKYESDVDVNSISEAEFGDISKDYNEDGKDPDIDEKVSSIDMAPSVTSVSRAYAPLVDVEDIPFPNRDHDMISAKSYLQKPSAIDGLSLYDHLSDILEKVLTERPKNVIDFFEDYSLKMKEARYQPRTDHLRDMYTSPWEYGNSKKLLPLLKGGRTEDQEIDEEQEAAVENEEGIEEDKADIMEMLFYFEQAGIGLPKGDMFCIALSILKLGRNKTIEKIRFWGKIFGIEKNYIIAETELTEDEYARRNAEAEELKKLQEEELQASQAPPPEPETKAKPIPDSLQPVVVVQKHQDAEEDVEPVLPEPVEIKPFPEYPVPKSLFQPPPEVPPEISGEGLNKKVYFICNEPGDEWIMLPDIEPKQIAVARKIKKYFTGNLETEINSFPPFPGKEKNYLRAQIARISAGTQISPLGFYSFGGGEEEEEEEAEEEEEGGGARTSYNVNPNYEILPLKDLVDVSMSYWVHHTPYILKQGRTIWWNPKPKKEADEEEAEDEGEEEEEEGGVEKEAGPPLLTPLSEDATLETIPPWSVRASSALVKQHAVGVVRSNLWPGANAFAYGKKFDNLYIGYGHKYTARNYSPPGMDPIQQEYPIGPEILEAVDPTPEEEEAWRIAHLPKPKVVEEEEKGEEEEEENEDEEDEDD